MKTRFPILIAVVPAALAVAGCGGGKSAAPSTPATSQPATTAAAANAPGALQAEAATAATGDIPDNQVFLVFRDARPASR